MKKIFYKISLFAFVLIIFFGFNSPFLFGQGNLFEPLEDIEKNIKDLTIFILLGLAIGLWQLILKNRQIYQRLQHNVLYILINFRSIKIDCI